MADSDRCLGRSGAHRALVVETAASFGLSSSTFLRLTTRERESRHPQHGYQAGVRHTRCNTCRSEDPFARLGLAPVQVVSSAPPQRSVIPALRRGNLAPHSTDIKLELGTITETAAQPGPTTTQVPQPDAEAQSQSSPSPTKHPSPRPAPPSSTPTAPPARSARRGRRGP